MLIGIYIVFVVLVLFGLTVFVHELGHFILARCLGLVVDVFSIGFGPAIWSRKHKGITYKIGIIPFGGYVSLPQLDPASMAVVQGKGERDAADGGTAAAAPASPSSKILVSVAGAVGNLILAVILAWIVYLAAKPAAEAPRANPVLGYVTTNSLAYEKGLRAGDEVLAVNGESVSTWQQFLQLMALSEEVNLTVKTADRVSHVLLPTEKDELKMRTIRGIEASSVCRVLKVQPGWSAAKAGLETGDIIRSFDGIRVGSSRHLIDLVSGCAQKTVPMTVERGGQTLTLTVTPEMDPQMKRARIGIHFDTMGVQMDELAHRKPWEQIANDATAIVRMLRALVTPGEARQAAEGIGGPPMILVTLWFVVKTSLLSALSFTRFLNVNLAILNLLPIPVLDGGHILFALWELVTRRRISPKVANGLVNVFAVIVIGLILLLCFRDIGRLMDLRRILRSESGAGPPDQRAASNQIDRLREPAPSGTNSSE